MTTKTKHSRSRSIWGGLLALTVVLGSVANWTSGSVTAQGVGGVKSITGTLSVDLGTDPLAYVGLVDLTGFVRRDYDYVQGDSLIVGWIDHASGNYRIDFPAVPSGPLNDITHGQGAGQGVQIYSVDQFWNLVGDERLSPVEFTGWAWSNTSILTAHGTHEIVGGRILVWAPDDAQRFPTDFGADGKLFTADDPLGPIPPGWTMVDLDERPFALDRSAQVGIAIGQDESSPDDLSQLPPTVAFDRMIDILKARYPFGDAIPLDWDALRATYRPEFVAAEESGERVDFWLALNHFLIALHNSSYWSIYPLYDDVLPRILGSTGLHVDLTDDGTVIVAQVDPGQAAEQAGIRVGAELVAWDGKPAAQAVAETVQFYTESSPQAILWLKIESFGRAPVGTKVHVEYQNPDAAETAAADLKAVEIPNEQIGHSMCCYEPWNTFDDLNPPVRVRLLPSNLAVIQLQMFAANDAESTRLIVDNWERALTLLGNTDVRGLIVDLRIPSDVGLGTIPIALAGSFFDDPFPLADVTSVDADGNEVTVKTLSVQPSPVQWDRPVALLIGSDCQDACEQFVLALTHRPNTIIAGMSATGGAMASSSESILLPTGNFVTVVDRAYRDPTTHEVLVEGKGIEPNLRVPKTAETIAANATTDLVLNAAEQALLDQIAVDQVGPEATPEVTRPGSWATRIMEERQ
jgi:C-terminal processing protease CtpA/Prc